MRRNKNEQEKYEVVETRKRNIMEKEEIEV